MGAAPIGWKPEILKNWKAAARPRRRRFSGFQISRLPLAPPRGPAPTALLPAARPVRRSRPRVTRRAGAIGVAMPRPRVPRRRALRDSGGPPRAAPGSAPRPPVTTSAAARRFNSKTWEAGILGGVLDLERLAAAGRGER